MKSSAVPVKNVDVAHDLAKENARLSQDVIRMSIDLEDHKRNETRAARGKWSSGKPGKLTGFKSSKDLHLKSALHTQEINLQGSVIGESLNATALHPDREHADLLETVEEENNGSENYKAFPMKERLSKMKQTLQQREAVAINDADLDALSVSKTALDSPVKRSSLRTQDARLQKLKKEYKSVKDEEKKSLIDYEKEREEQKAQTTASVVNLHVPDQPTGSEVNAPLVNRSRKAGSVVGSNAAKSQKSINSIPVNDEANSHVMLPPHGSALYSNNASNSDYLQKQRRKKRTAHYSPVKRPSRVNDEEDSLIISSTKEKPEPTGPAAPKILPVKESTKYTYDAPLSDWLQTLNLKDVERVKDLFFSNNISLIKMPIITHKDLTRFGFKQSDPDFVKILRGLIELKEDCAKHPEKYKLNVQRSKERESKQFGKPTPGNRRMLNETSNEKGGKSSSGNVEAVEGLLPPISSSQVLGQSEGVDIPAPQHVLLERVGSGSLVNHAVELQQIEEHETSGVSSLSFSMTDADRNDVQSLLTSEDVTEAMVSGRDPKLSQEHDVTSKFVDRDIVDDSGIASEVKTNEEVDDRDSSRKISNATTTASFVPLYNKDPAKLSKVLSSDLARKDALTAVEQATKKWEKKQKEQEQIQEKAEGVKAERQERRDRLAARHHHKTSITAVTVSSNAMSNANKAGTTKQKQQTGSTAGVGVRGTLDGENASSSPERVPVPNQLITAEAVEQATKKWEKKQKEQEQIQEKAEGVKAERQERRDRLAARHHHKTSITAVTVSSNAMSNANKAGTTKQKQQTGSTAGVGVRGTLDGENASSSPERVPVPNQLITAEVGSIAGDTEFELVGAKIKPLMTTRGLMQNNPYSKQSTSMQAGASVQQTGVVTNPMSKKKYPQDQLPTSDIIDKENGGLVLEGKAVINSPRIEPNKLNTQRTVRADIPKSEQLEEFQMKEGPESRSKTFDKEFSSIKHDLEEALNQLEGTPRLEEKPLKQEHFGTLEEAVKMRKTSNDQLSALAKERETMKMSSLNEREPFRERTTESTEIERGAETPVAQEKSRTISPNFVVSEKSLNVHDDNDVTSEYSGGSKSTVSTNSTHDLLQQLDMKLQVLKHSGSTPETLSMIEKIKVQLAQFELGMTGTGSTRVLSDYPSYARRNRARTVASAKLSQYKHTPVREMLMPGRDLPGQAKSSSKAKTLMSLKASMAEQDMVKNLQKQQTQYKQQIRHLERELKRLKEHDPLSACELNIEDLQFSEEDFIGDGAFADVFWGYYSGSEVAIKRLKGLLSSSDESYFNAEVALLRELRHPNVVLLLGVCRDAEQRPLMVLEYMANGSLFDVLHDFERSGLDHVAFYQISKDMAVGMNYLHRHKPGPVLHLDLKSMNVLLDGYGRAKIGDFGFSKLKSSTESGTEKQLSVESRKGSPAWMAPETLQQGKVSTKSDVYSFGVILWEMLTREKPYEGMGLFHVLEGVTKGLRPIIPGWVPEELQALINSCWHAQPAQRPSFQDVLDILDNLHLPMEWKSLLDAAGVPRIALEDPDVTRSIVEFVHLSLNVSDSSSSVPTSGGGLSESLLHEERQMIDLEVVSAFEMLTRKQKEKSYQSLVPALTNLSGSTSEKSSLLNSQMKDIESLLDKSSSDVTPRASSQMQPQSNINEKREQPNLFTHESRPRTVIGTAGEPMRPQISDTVLQLQKSKLRPTTVAPHPSQLANLASVDEGRLSSIAAVIKQALNERREYMLEDTRDADVDPGETSTIGSISSRSGIAPE